MSKVVKMINTSKATVPVELARGETVFVPPRGVVENEEVNGLDKVRKYFNVREDLTEVGNSLPPAQNLTEVGRTPPEIPLQNLNEVAPVLPKVRKRRAPRR